MIELKEYINNVLGDELVIRQFDIRILSGLPLYITASYKIHRTDIVGNEICLLVAKTRENTFTPDQLAKQMGLVSQRTGLPVVFVFEKIESYNIGRLIKKKVSFIVPGKQLYIPALAMHLQKVSDNRKKEISTLTPVAQLLLFYHLQKELLNGKTARQIGEKVCQEYRTINRAINNLAGLDLIRLEGGKEKHIRFNYPGRELWNKSLQYQKNPTMRLLYTDEVLISVKMCLSNINALSHHTMLNDELRQHYAVYKKDMKDWKVKTDKYFGDNTIEIWCYDPVILCCDTYVDKLSLYLLLKDDEDERVQGALEKMINEIEWLED